MHRLYSEFAEWWPLLSAPEDYACEADFYRRTLVDACASPPRSLLELGSGGGNNASHLKKHFDMVLVDQSPGMLQVSQRLNPECVHVSGDMRSARLSREFDAVFIHDAVCYMTTLADLAAAAETAAIHCRQAGAVLFAPDFVKENFRPGTDHGGEDGADGRGLRYLEWVYDPDSADTTYHVDYAYLLRHADQRVEVAHDQHLEGLFTRSQWLDVLHTAGFEPRIVPFIEPEVDYVIELIVGVKR
jgi:SAM-dependent methyltransferase